MFIKLARQIARILDDGTTTEEILNWMLTIDEDELISNTPEQLSEMYY